MDNSEVNIRREVFVRNVTRVYGASTSLPILPNATGLLIRNLDRSKGPVMRPSYATLAEMREGERRFREALLVQEGKMVPPLYSAAMGPAHLMVAQAAGMATSRVAWGLVGKYAGPAIGMGRELYKEFEPVIKKVFEPKTDSASEDKDQPKSLKQ